MFQFFLNPLEFGSNFDYFIYLFFFLIDYSEIKISNIQNMTYNCPHEYCLGTIYLSLNILTV